MPETRAIEHDQDYETCHVCKGEQVLPVPVYRLNRAQTASGEFTYWSEDWQPEPCYHCGGLGAVPKGK